MDQMPICAEHELKLRGLQALTNQCRAGLCRQASHLRYGPGRLYRTRFLAYPQRSACLLLVGGTGGGIGDVSMIEERKGA